NSLMQSLDSFPTDILRDFFSKNENSKNLFTWAREFETLGFKKVFDKPESIDAPLKGVISVILDFNKIDRKKFFDSYLRISVPPIITKDKNDTGDEKQYRL